jgi:hypothetical protein
LHCIVVCRKDTDDIQTLFFLDFAESFLVVGLLLGEDTYQLILDGYDSGKQTLRGGNIQIRRK